MKQRIVGRIAILRERYPAVPAKEEEGFIAAISDTVMNIGAVMILFEKGGTNLEMHPSMWQWEVRGGLNLLP